MWPIQTLTLLLCLTDDEQLFAQRPPLVPEPVLIEMEVEQQEPQAVTTELSWPASC